MQKVERCALDCEERCNGKRHGCCARAQMSVSRPADSDASGCASRRRDALHAPNASTIREVPASIAGNDGGVILQRLSRTTSSPVTADQPAEICESHPVDHPVSGITVEMWKCTRRGRRVLPFRSSF